jgi:hypothetical protein
LLEALVRDGIKGPNVTDSGVPGEVVGESDMFCRHGGPYRLPEVLGLGRATTKRVEEMAVLNAAEFVDCSVRILYTFFDEGVEGRADIVVGAYGDANDLEPLDYGYAATRDVAVMGLGDIRAGDPHLGTDAETALCYAKVAPTLDDRHGHRDMGGSDVAGVHTSVPVGAGISAGFCDGALDGLAGGV